MYPSIYPSIHPSIHLTVCPSTHSFGQPGQKFLSVRLSRTHSFIHSLMHSIQRQIYRPLVSHTLSRTHVSLPKWKSQTPRKCFPPNSRFPGPSFTLHLKPYSLLSAHTPAMTYSPRS